MHQDNSQHHTARILYRAGVVHASGAALPDMVHQDSSQQPLPWQSPVMIPEEHAPGAAVPDVIAILLISDLGNRVSLLPKEAPRAKPLEGLELLLQLGGQLILPEGVGRLPLAFRGAHLQMQQNKPYSARHTQMCQLLIMRKFDNNSHQ